MSEWSLEKRHLPLKFTWKISRNSSTFKENFFVRFRIGEHEGVGEVAPNIRYGETPDKIEDDFLLFQSEFRKREFQTLIQLHNFLKEMSLAHSLKFGIESAFTHFLCQKLNKSIHEFFNLPSVTHAVTSFSIPIIEIDEVEKFIEPIKNYEYLKIKVNKETGVALIKEVSKFTKAKLRIDANEGWESADQVLGFFDEIKDCNIEFIEQPMPASRKDEYKKLFPKSPYLLIADESIEDQADFTELKSMFHGINVKLMKTGSYLTAINLLKEAKRHQMKTMMGCMVETSLGIKSAYELSSLADFLDLDGFLLLKNDPFHLLKEENGTITLAQ